MTTIVTARLYPEVESESCDVDLSCSGYVKLDYRESRIISDLAHFQNLFWIKRANLRWFAKALHTCAAYDRVNATMHCPEAILVRGHDSLSIADNGADYAIYVWVSNRRGADAPHGSSTGGYSFAMSLPLAELLANELLALSASDGDEAR